MKRKSIKFWVLLMAGMLGICTSVKAEPLSAGSSGRISENKFAGGDGNNRG